jgi:hypothetical protein
MSYPQYIERMLAGSAVLCTRLVDGDEEGNERLGILRLSECLEILNFWTSDEEEITEQLHLKEVKHVEISDCVDLYLGSEHIVRLEFPDSKIFADWSYGLQVLTVESEMSSQEISDLLQEASDLNAKLLVDNFRLQRAVELRDDLIRQLVDKLDNIDAPAPARIFTDWHKVPKQEIEEVHSARRSAVTRDA